MESNESWWSPYINNADAISELNDLIASAARRRGDIPGIRELKTSIDSLSNLTFDDALPHFRKFANCTAVSEFIDQESNLCRRNCVYQPPGRSSANEITQGIEICSSERYSVLAMVADPTAIVSMAKKRQIIGNDVNTVATTPTDTFMHFMRGGGARATIYTCDSIGHNQHVDADMVCREDRTFDINDGDELILRAGKDSIVLDYAKSLVSFIEAHIEPPQVAAAPIFDAQTLKLVGVMSSTLRSSRIQMMVTALSKLSPSKKSFDTCSPLLSHDDYFVRWYVMRELVAMDTKGSSPLLQHLADEDVHPDVRMAAASTLEIIKKQHQIAAP